MRCFASLSMTGWRMSPRAPLCHPEPLSFVAPSLLFVTPSGSEGSLGTCVPLDDIPKEVGDASLSLGRTIKRTLGRTKKDAQQDKKRWLGRIK